MDEPQKQLLRLLPSCAYLLELDPIKALSKEFGQGIVKWHIRLRLDALRKSIINGTICDEMIDEDYILNLIKDDLLRSSSPKGRMAINATGILLHTGLGRAPFAQSVIDHLQVMNDYTLLQADVQSGARSEREAKIEQMLCELTHCQAATVVNNNAAATMLILNTLCKNKEAIISRGQLVEIGGAFRIPDVMEQSGAVLKEIGCTNRTHIKDYLAALNSNSGAFLHVHTSNYRIRGFTTMPSIEDICKMRDEHAPNMVVIDDLGSGALVPLAPFGATNEPLIKDSILAGADVVCFSGDKLISGPQAGIICGKKEYIDRIKKSPYMRMFRCCKMTLCALESTFLHFINESYQTEIPFYQMLSTPLETLQARAEYISQNIEDVISLSHYTQEIKPTTAYIGSGSSPDEGITSIGIFLSPSKNAKLSIENLAVSLRQNIPAIFTRIEKNALIFDMRTLSENASENVITSIRNHFE